VGTEREDDNGTKRRNMEDGHVPAFRLDLGVSVCHVSFDSSLEGCRLSECGDRSFTGVQRFRDLRRDVQ